MLSGYGPHTRDYEEDGIKKYDVLAKQLANHGIASLRYDDRGTGKSSLVTWSDYNFSDLSDEVLAAIKFLEQHSLLDPKKIGLLGHSLGAAIAAKTASRTDTVKFIVLMGGYGLVGKETGLITRRCIGKLFSETEDA